jgi:hypothetical protein
MVALTCDIPQDFHHYLNDGHGWMDGWIDGWMDEWTDRWKDGWIYDPK